jgi:menaquinone-dependent protoporphyrinogen IX oxidase
MSEILIVYDTTEGQSRKIAQHVAARRPSSSTCERNTG